MVHLEAGRCFDQEGIRVVDTAGHYQGGSREKKKKKKFITPSKRAENPPELPRYHVTLGCV